MKDFNFSRWNKILGWAAFVIALLTYSLTVQPTASFWDPGEFIATSAKLQVGHPPGAPLFQMLGAFLANFAIDQAHIALMVNMISVLSSAFTILFLFWSISLVVRKIAGSANTLAPGEKTAVLGSALVGALAFAFTDSFWFSAVEAEVYGAAMLFMSALFYVGLLWERDLFKPRGNRWLILLAFLVGLTFGVHFLALLAVPAIGYMYYFKTTEKITAKNFIIASVVVVGVLLFIFKLLLPYSLTFFAASEVFFVNSIGLPFNSGTIIAAVLLVAIFYYGLRYTRSKGYIQLNTILLCVLFIFMGFSCWLMLPIRANAGTNINENNPENARQLLAYYNREQYPDHALFYGPQFTNALAGLNQTNPYVDGEPKYTENHKTGRYEVVNNWKNAKQNGPDDQNAFLPRMWSTSDSHMANYMNMTGPVPFHLKPKYMGQTKLRNLVNQVKSGYAQDKIDNEGLVRFFNEYRQYLTIEKPTFGANMSYMLKYQFGYMYFRYFMWNFVGRQNDKQGEYGNLKGNWLSGIDVIDSLFLGAQKNLPDLVKNDISRNTYFFLPLLLGLIGLFFHYDKDKRTFWVVMVLFLFTGTALVIYLNARPFEPRERDYTFVGSFFAFTIWIGLGVYALFNKLRKRLKPKLLAPIVTVVCLLAVPGVLAQQNWGDHDRSGNRMATALAKNYLMPVGENGILFTVGDNDTFPLWYAQEIEKYRTDVKIINTSLFATPWYIDQMKRQTYNSPPIETTLAHEDYKYGTNDVIIYKPDPRMPDTMTVENWLKYVKSDDPSTMIQLQNGHSLHTFPTKTLILPVNKANVIASGIVDSEDKNLIVDYIPITIGSSQIAKNTLLMLDAVANTDWKRPVFFTGGSYTDATYLWMKDYLQLVGLSYELVPIKTEAPDYKLGRIEADEQYEQVMNWEWGNSGEPGLHYGPTARRNSISYRSIMARLVTKLIAENAPKKAEDILDLAMAKMPVDKFEYYTFVTPFIADYYKIGKPEKAREITAQLVDIYQQKLAYFNGLTLAAQQDYLSEIYTAIKRYKDLIDIAQSNDSAAVWQPEAKAFNAQLGQFSQAFKGLERLKYTNLPTSNSGD